MINSNCNTNNFLEIIKSHLNEIRNEALAPSLLKLLEVSEEMETEKESKRVF